MASPSSALQDALRDLPHGSGFRFVDELVQLDPGGSGVGHYHVKGIEPFLEAHFPGRPMMPAVIMVEALAQLGGVIAQADPHHPKMSDVRLTALRNVKVFGTATPGTCLTLHVTLEARLGPLVQFEGEVKDSESTLVKAHFTLSGQLEGDLAVSNKSRSPESRS